MLTCCEKPEKTKQQLTLNNVLKGDPTRTLTTRKRFIADMNKRFNRLRREIFEAIVLNDVFGLNDEPIQFLQSRPRQFAFPRDVDKLRAFEGWLQQQINIGILEVTTIGGATRIGDLENWTDKYIQSAYQRGISRGRQELIRAGADVPTLAETGGIQAAFNQPFHINRLQMVATRTFEELKNVTVGMSNDISRTLAQALAEGLSPRQIVFGTDTLKGLNNDIKKAMIRARAIARTEVIRAHHAANIQEYKAAGIEGVEVIAEWSVAGFNVCPLCFPLEGKKFKLDQIEGMIPRHVNCRCVAIPLVDKEARDAKTISQDEGLKLGDDNIAKGKDAARS